jgi:4-hydroxy-3-methylbut-2-enyl diphosphate reductase
MLIRLASSYGFCFGVERAIEMAENAGKATTIGPLIHNNKEIERLRESFDVDTVEDLAKFNFSTKAIIRTHGIPKKDLESLESRNVAIVDATCPYVTKLQNIVEDMSKLGYQVVIFGDINHPEVKAAKSYALNEPVVILSKEELTKQKLHGKIAVVSQTTRKPEIFLEIVNYLVLRHKEVRVFNTICNATFDNQDAARDLSKESDVMIIIGGKNSSNTKQLLHISKEHCRDSFLIEGEDELEQHWFKGKKMCGITAGASTPKWIIDKIIEKIRNFEL